MQKMLALLSEIRPDIDFANENNLVDSGLLDSMDIIGIAVAIQKQYGIKLNITLLNPQNFNSANAIFELVENLKQQASH